MMTGAALASTSAPAQPATYHFVTIAGDLSQGSANGTNSDALFNFPTGLALNSNGELFVADEENHTIRKLSWNGTAWVSSTIAGLAGRAGASDGMNAEARFICPESVAVDGAGNVFVADSCSMTVRELSPIGTNWLVKTIAGLAGVEGRTDGTNQDIRFSWPTGVGFNRDGELLVADNDAIRKLQQFGTDWVSSTLPVITDGFGYVHKIAVDSTNGLYAAGAYFIGNDGFYGLVATIIPEGTNWLGVPLSRAPDGNRGFLQITTGANGQVFVAKENNTIWELDANATNWTWHLVAGQSGIVGSTDGTNDAALFSDPTGIAADSSGNLFVADSDNNTVRKLTRVGSNWVASTIAGRPPIADGIDGTNRAARFGVPIGVVVNKSGTLFVADFGAHAIRETVKIGGDYVTRTIAGSLGISGSSDGTNDQARFKNPIALALDSSGALYVVDSGNNTIRRLEQFGTNWVTSTIAGLAGSTNWQDGINSDIRFVGLDAIAIDASGALYVAEEGWPQDIRKLTPLGTDWISSTLSGPAGPLSVGYPSALAVSAGGILYVGHAYGGLAQLRASGGNWSASEITGAENVYATGLVVDSSGNLVVCDANTIRKLVCSGTNWSSYTLAGSLNYPGLQDGTGGEAQFLDPHGVALDSAGNLYVTDGNTLRLGIRMSLAAQPPVMGTITVENGSLTFTWGAQPGLSYQAQYNTDLRSSNWLNLGDAVTATNQTMSSTDVSTSGRFYRVTLLP